LISAEEQEIADAKKLRRLKHKESTELADAIRPDNERRALLEKRRQRQKRRAN
jgi:hypothetical protein